MTNTSITFVGTALELPTALEEAGFLLGWSGEDHDDRTRVGFGFGRPDVGPRTGVADPVVMLGEGHAITIAPTGAGKGTGCVIPALLLAPGQVIVIDPKGENVAITARRRREMGQRVVIIDPMGITEATTGQASDTLNPLDLLDPASPTFIDDTYALVSGLLPSDFSRTTTDGRYWQDRGMTMVLAVLLHVLCDHPPGARHLGTVRRLVNRMVGEVGIYVAFAEGRQGVSLNGTVLGDLERSTSAEAREISSSLKMGALTTIGGILSFSQSMLDFVRNGPIEENMATTSFDLDGITRGDPLSIYLVLPPKMLASHGRVMRVWVSALLNQVTKRTGKLEHPTLFILDEAAQLGTFEMLRTAVTLLRAYSLQTWSFWQDVSQLRNLYPADWQTMVNNCRAVQCFGPNTMLAAREMCELVGYAGGAEALLTAGPRELLLQLASDPASVAMLPDYRKDPVFAGLFDENPMHRPQSRDLPKSTQVREAIASAEGPKETSLESAVDPLSQDLAGWLERIAARKTSSS
jgi:type IV secretion system protein VirD4